MKFDVHAKSTSNQLIGPDNSNISAHAMRPADEHRPIITVMKINLSTRDHPASQLSSHCTLLRREGGGDEISSIRFRDGIKSGFPTVFPEYYPRFQLLQSPPSLSPFFVIRRIIRQNPLKRPPRVYSSIKILIIIKYRSFIAREIYKRIIRRNSV